MDPAALPASAAPPPPSLLLLDETPAPCAAWSQHAADLAEHIGPLIQAWPDTPSTRELVREGHLLRLRGDLHIPADACEGAVPRAIAVGCAVGADLRSHQIIAGRTAAWVHTGGAPPDPLELISTAHRTVIPGIRVHQSRIRAGDVEVVGGTPVSTPGRIATDLLRGHPEREALESLARLVASGHLVLSEVERRLDALAGRPGTRRARRLLEGRAGEDQAVADPAGAARAAPDSTCLPSAVTR